MPDKITSKVHLFADDTKISLRLTNQNQTNNLQNDIDRLDKWSDRWKLRFNVAKCKTIHIEYHNDKHIYQMGSGESRMDLNQVTSEKDYFPGRPPVYQTLGGQSQKGELHARSYSSQFPTHRQRDAYTSLQGSRPSSRGVCFKCVVTSQAPWHKADRSPEKSNKTVKRPSEWTIQHQTHHPGHTNTSIQKRKSWHVASIQNPERIRGRDLDIFPKMFQFK